MKKVPASGFHHHPPTIILDIPPTAFARAHGRPHDEVMRGLVTIAFAALCVVGAASARVSGLARHDAADTGRAHLRGAVSAETGLRAPKMSGYLPVQQGSSESLFFAFWEAQERHGEDQGDAPIILWLQVDLMSCQPHDHWRDLQLLVGALQLLVLWGGACGGGGAAHCKKAQHTLNAHDASMVPC